jgi:hypothetical protein
MLLVWPVTFQTPLLSTDAHHALREPDTCTAMTQNDQSSVVLVIGWHEFLCELGLLQM